MKSKELHPRNQSVLKPSQRRMHARAMCRALFWVASPLTILFAAVISPAQARISLPGDATNAPTVDDGSPSGSKPNNAAAAHAVPAINITAENRADGALRYETSDGGRTPTALRASIVVQTPVAEPQQPEITANPGRPSMSASALLTPIGYAQLENGVLYAAGSAEFTSRSAAEETVRITVTPRVQFILGSEPIANSLVVDQNLIQQGDVTGGTQVVLMPGQAAKPTISVSYLRLLRSGEATNLDIGGFTNSALILASNDMGHFHVDVNGFLNETAGRIRRAQFGQALAVTHPLVQKLSGTAELRHFSEPLNTGDGLSAMFAFAYSVRSPLVLDAGVARGFTGTSTTWQISSGVTYVLPHKIWGFSSSAR